ncbi:hypothetical protein HYZ80_04120 [Candidatus Parcubacteria bacterium]|nr:hypothetical protein [Candidatus Parcubacteria bacterium]
MAPTTLTAVEAVMFARSQPSYTGRERENESLDEFEVDVFRVPPPGTGTPDTVSVVLVEVDPDRVSYPAAHAPMGAAATIATANTTHANIIFIFFMAPPFAADRLVAAKPTAPNSQRTGLGFRLVWPTIEP